MKAIIHHGGAGTTAAALRSGKPTVICPFFGDQPFWARRVAQLGVSPPPLRRKALTADAIAAAVTAMTNPEMQRKGASIAAAIDKEKGVDEAVHFVERLVAKGAV